VQGEQPASSAKLKPQVIILGLVSLLNDSASEMIYPLLPVFLTTTLGASAVVVGLIEGAADALASILKFVAGTWSDRMPRRRPLIASGYTLAALSRGLIAAATTWPMVLAARMIDRTGKGIRSAPRDAMIADVTPAEHRGKAFGFHRALDHTGAIVGPLLAMMLLDWAHMGMRTVFAISVIPGLIGVALILGFLKEPSHAAAATKRVELAQPAQLPAGFWAAISAVALFSLANSSDAFLLLQAHSAGVPTAMLPALWAAHHVIKALFSTRAGAFSDRIDRRWLLISGWTLYAIIYFVFPYAHSMTAFVILFVVYALPFTLTEGAERAWIAQHAPAEIRGRSFGYYYLTNGVCVLAGTALFGWIYDRVGHAGAFRVGAGLALLAAIWVLAMRLGERTPA
jgi:MFS family permease